MDERRVSFTIGVVTFGRKPRQFVQLALAGGSYFFSGVGITMVRALFVNR